VDVKVLAANDMSDLADWTWAETGTGTGGGSGGGLPTPAGATLKAWWDASRITGLANGAALSTWADLSGGGFNLTQATPANQPLYYSSTAGKTVNGRPAVWFDGNQAYVANSALTQAAGSTWSVMVVFQDLTHTTPFIVYRTSIANYFGSPASHNWIVYTTQFGAADDNLHMAVVRYAPSASAADLDGTHYLLSPDPNADADRFWLGFSASSLNGPVCECTYYTGRLTDADVVNLRAYCQSKWGTP
jgi:hypothetical protein